MNTLLRSVNTLYERAPYVLPMVTTVRAKPGAKKGVPKPLKRRLDPGFPSRFRAALEMQKITEAELARRVGCSRQAIYRYLSGEAAYMDPHLLLDICEELGISPRLLIPRVPLK